MKKYKKIWYYISESLYKSEYYMLCLNTHLNNNIIIEEKNSFISDFSTLALFVVFPESHSIEN